MPLRECLMYRRPLLNVILMIRISLQMMRKKHLGRSTILPPEIENEKGSKRSNRCPKRKDSSHKIAKPKRGQNKKNKKAQSLTDSQEGVDADWYCFLCGETRVESMAQCQSCKRWVHTECSNESDTSGYKCDLC